MNTYKIVKVALPCESNRVANGSLPIETPALVSPFTQGRDYCDTCGESFGPLVYSQTMPARSHHTRAQCPGIFHFHTRHDPRAKAGHGELLFEAIAACKRLDEPLGHCDAISNCYYASKLQLGRIIHVSSYACDCQRPHEEYNLIEENLRAFLAPEHRHLKPPEWIKLSRKYCPAFSHYHLLVPVCPRVPPPDGGRALSLHLRDGYALFSDEWAR